MGAVPVSSVGPGFLPAVRQLRLLEGGDAAELQSCRPVGDPRAVTGWVGQPVVAEVPVDLSLTDHVLALVAARTCFCCGGSMADVEAGPALRCQVCGAEAAVIVAA